MGRHILIGLDDDFNRLAYWSAKAISRAASQKVNR
jgi:hypothetical protein